MGVSTNQDQDLNLNCDMDDSELGSMPPTIKHRGGGKVHVEKFSVKD